MAIKIFAYIDPGSGATFSTSLTPVFIALGIAFAFILIRIFWKPLINILIKNRPNSDDNPEQ